MPAIRSVKNASAPRERAGRASAKPTALARAPTSARAAELGCHPFSSTIPRMRCLVSSLTPGRPLRAKDTAPGETPAIRAMSAIVTRFPVAMRFTLLDRLAAARPGA
jgi:hypothetical protein